MIQYIVRGGKPLCGEVTIAGAKNAALGILAAAVMTDEEVTVENIPDVSDINSLLEAIRGIGAKVDRIDKNTVKICGATINSTTVNYDYITKIRASYYLIGALLGKYGAASVAMPGGCKIGSRPIDQHIKGFKKLGAKVSESDMITATASELKGNHIFLDIVSVGATINIMLAAVLANGLTIIENVAKEPHIVDVANFLNSMGANIKGAGTDVIRIMGVEKLHGSTYSCIPDQIEAGTFMCLAVATKGDITVKNIIPKHMEAISAKLVEIGAEVYEEDDSIRVISKGRPIGSTVKTRVYPGFPTDMQPQIAVVLSMADGNSIINESIWEARFKYVAELRKMGAVITVEGNTAFIEGRDLLTPAAMAVPDLRAGAALTIAALAAEGISTLTDIEYIERGYEDFDGKLRALGASIKKVDSEDDKEITKFKMQVV
ncbi:MAG: UDP-N-acetylglucosamine 1-carboxyvinyltransferase [Clostridiales bacterium]|nr:UDP-N-acetylglucosamine 1-carboxyvinyltransferase [Clostridiales bacterium]